ncbi:MAG TPA: hypothetical protein VHR45_25950 [Thermoanaerobaculia bacterium]|nr:hypothetical protein [Thermoanaerobaculia bacterium]
MSDHKAEETKGHGDETPGDLKDRVRAVAARLREAAEDLGGEVMLDIPSRLGDQKGLILALANELERLVG